MRQFYSAIVQCSCGTTHDPQVSQNRLTTSSPESAFLAYVLGCAPVSLWISTALGCITRRNAALHASESGSRCCCHSHSTAIAAAVGAVCVRVSDSFRSKVEVDEVEVPR